MITVLLIIVYIVAAESAWCAQSNKNFFCLECYCLRGVLPHFFYYLKCQIFIYVTDFYQCKLFANKHGLD